MRVLVAGCSGYLGTEVCKELLKKGADIIGVDIVPSSLDIEFAKVNIASKSSSHKLKKYKPDVICNCAALVPLTRASYKEMMLVNALGAMNLARVHPWKLVHISSSAVYGAPKELIKDDTPLSPIETYGKSKAMAEMILRSFIDINIVIIRPRTIIGESRIGVFDILFNRALYNRPIYIIGNGNNRFQLLSLEDCVDFIIRAIYDVRAIGSYNIGTDKYSTLRADLQEFLNRARSKSRIVSIPKSSKLLLKILDKLGLISLTPWHYMTIDTNFHFDISRAKKLGWIPKHSNVDMLLSAYSSYVKQIEGRSIQARKLSRRWLAWF